MSKLWIRREYHRRGHRYLFESVESSSMVWPELEENMSDEQLEKAARTLALEELNMNRAEVGLRGLRRLQNS